MLLAHRTLHCYFWGEGHIVLIECLQSWTDMGGKYLSLLVLRNFLLVPGRRDLLMLTHISHLGTNTLSCGKTKIRFYVLFSLSTLSIDFGCLKPRDLLGPDPKKLISSMLGDLDFPMSPLRWHSSKEQQFLFRLWIYRLIFSAIFISFPESQGRLVKSC